MIDPLLEQGLAASQANDSVRALDLFAQASAAAPTAGLPHFLMASEWASLGEIEKAEAAFANAVLLAPDLTIARYQLGLLQFSSGRAALALVVWQPLLQLADTDPLPHFVRGFTALAQDAFAQALLHYRAGLERNTTNPALSNDVQKVIAPIESLLLAQDAAHAPTEQDLAADSSQDNHILLSNYQKRLH